MQAFAWGEIVATLSDLKEGQPACIPNYDFRTSSRQAQATSVESADVILFDGILAFYSAGTVPLLLTRHLQGTRAGSPSFSAKAAISHGTDWRCLTDRGDQASCPGMFCMCI